MRVRPPRHLHTNPDGSLRAGGASERPRAIWRAIGNKPPPFITLSHRPVTLLSWPRAPLGLDLVPSKPRVPCGAFFMAVASLLAGQGNISALAARPSP